MFFDYLHNIITTLYNDIIIRNITTLYVNTIKGVRNCLKCFIKEFIRKYRNMW